jgi:hypothetical protein
MCHTAVLEVRVFYEFCGFYEFVWACCHVFGGFGLVVVLPLFGAFLMVFGY